MRLKTLELQGFKSFPDKTALSFDHPLTAIVGPNGSGKSNLSDSIRWVLGEQSVKTLRGGKMEDVIFGGSRDRSRQGFAQVSLTLDHCEDLLPDGGHEVTVSRRYYRSGESEYLLNGKQVRLRDVHELFMDTGLGQEGYALIGQGKIDAILSAKSTQRREIFEEAAGISHCRHQQEETQRKLERTQENLVRIGDKLEELELQREPLRLQAEKAKEYFALRDELRVLEISLWMDQVDQQREKTTKLRQDHSAAQEQLVACTKEADALYARSEELLLQVRDAEAQGEALRAKLSQTETELRDGQQRTALLRAKVQNNGDNAARIRRDLSDRAARQAEVEADLTRQKDRLAALRRQEETCQSDLTKAQAEAHRLQTQLKQAHTAWEEALRRGRDRLAQCRRLEKEAEEAWMAQRVEEQALASRVKLLQDMTAVYEGYAKGVKTAMGEVKGGNLPGVLGPVGELFHVPARYTVALETALGGAMQNLIVEDEASGKGVLQFLKRRDGGRVTCLPLTALRPAVLREEGIENEPGFLAVAADLVECDENCRPAARSLLGRTVVVSTLDDGIRMAKARSYRFPVVTLDGEILRPGGSMTGGSVNRKGGILSRAAEGENVNKKLTTVRAALEEARQKRETARQATVQAAEALERLQAGGPAEVTAVQEGQTQQAAEVTGLRERLAALQAEIRAFAPLLDQLTGQQTAAQADRVRQEALLETYQQENETIQREMADLEGKETALKTRQAQLSDQVRRNAGLKLQLEGDRTRTDRQAREKNDEQMRLQREVAALEQKKLQASMEETRLLDRLWDTYSMTHQGAQAVRVPIDSASKANRRAAQLNNAIQALGQVNPGAVEEFARVEERYTYLTDQKTDIETARTELEGVIHSITHEMQDVFLREFAKIQDAFAKTFADLFGGGQGTLALEDEGDILNCGIDIKVQPPGKTLRTLSLLSGGERALVAIALYFAILKVHPTPFCVLDEIEAALDEANGTRFIRYLRAAVRETQCLLITHRRAAMEAADVLYGVTMERQGVSRVLKLDLNQAEALLGKELK